jgi:hypothetical protein
MRDGPSPQRELTGNQRYGNDILTQNDILPHH